MAVLVYIFAKIAFLALFFNYHAMVHAKKLHLHLEKNLYED